MEVVAEGRGGAGCAMRWRAVGGLMPTVVVAPPIKVGGLGISHRQRRSRAVGGDRRWMVVQRGGGATPRPWVVGERGWSGEAVEAGQRREGGGGQRRERG
jgi:hypothetical protein